MNVSDIYKYNDEMNIIFIKSQEQIDNLNTHIDSKINEFYPLSAEEYIAKWENEFEVIPPPNSTIQERRNILLTRIQGFGTVTKSQLQAISSVYIGGTIVVREYPSTYAIEVLVRPENQPTDAQLQYLFDYLDDIVPAHLNLTVTIKYLRWADFDVYNYTWATVGTMNMTWEEWKLYDETN